jgi:8-oxo-dGTP pyrophosphatase MutT (NUDIX family)
MGYILELRRYVGNRPLILTGAAVIVRDGEGRLLLQRRSDTGDWGTIGGSMEPGESFEETAARELYEEAGLRAEAFRFVALLSGRDMYFRYPNGDEVYNAIAVFEAVGVSGDPAVNDDEGLELGWFHPDRPIPELNPMAAIILRKSGYVTERS